MGMLVIMFNQRTNSSKAILEAVNASYGEDIVFHTPISNREEVRLLPIRKKSLVRQKNSLTGQQYMAVVEEIISKEEQENG